MLTQIMIRGSIEWVSFWTKYRFFHPELEHNLGYTEIYLEGIKNPIEVPGALSDLLTGRAVQITKSFFRRGQNSRFETIHYQIFGDPDETLLLYDCSYRRKI